MYELYYNRSQKKRRRKVKWLITLAAIVVLVLGSWIAWAGVSRMFSSQAGGVSEFSESDCKTVGKPGPGGSYQEVCKPITN